MREFDERSRRRREGREGKKGSVPEMLDEERFSSWRSGREESVEMREEVEERLRKVFGRDREMTREEGEHVTPCHEHGVAEEGSHEGRRENGVEGRSERSAFPSWEREYSVWVRERKMMSEKKGLMVVAATIFVLWGVGSYKDERSINF